MLAKKVGSFYSYKTAFCSPYIQSNKLHFRRFADQASKEKIAKPNEKIDAGKKGDGKPKETPIEDPRKKKTDIKWTRINKEDYKPFSTQELANLRFDELWEVQEAVRIPRISLEEVAWFVAKKNLDDATVINIERIPYLKDSLLDRLTRHHLNLTRPKNLKEWKDDVPVKDLLIHILTTPEFVAEDITETDFRLNKGSITTLGQLRAATADQLKSLKVGKFVIDQIMKALK